MHNYSYYTRKLYVWSQNDLKGSINLQWGQILFVIPSLSFQALGLVRLLLCQAKGWGLVWHKKRYFFNSNKPTFDNTGVVRKALASKSTFRIYSGILGVSFPHWNHVYEVCKPSHINKKETHTFYQKSFQCRNFQQRTKITLCPWKQDIALGASNWHGMWDWQNIRDWNN